MKSLFSVLFLLSLNFVSAQTEQGAWLVGGGASFSQGMSDANKYTSFGLSPELSYCVINNLAVGGTAGFNYYKYPNIDPSYGFSVGPSARYYIGAAKFKPFAAASFRYAGSSYNGNLTSGYAWDAGIGFAYFLNDNVSLDLRALYTGSKFGSGPSNSSFYFPLGFQVVLGN